MTHAKDFLCALAIIAGIGFANAVCTNAGEYAAPTAEEIDVQRQMAHLCQADGWPEDSKIAFERACKGELRRPQIN